MRTILLFFLCLVGQSLSANTITVTNGNDAGPGSLRNALEQAKDGDIIELSGIEELTLSASLLTINKSVTIKGNGSTLRTNFSPIMKVATNATVRWERVHFEVPSRSFAQLASPRKASVIFVACSGQWEKTNPSLDNTTKNSTELVMEELREGGGINYFLAPCPDPDNCGGGGDIGDDNNPTCPISVITRNISVQLSTGGNATITPEQINNGSSATCGPFSLRLSRTFFTCDDIGPNIVTLSVTDANGSISSASATVTVVENIAPSIVSPQPVVVNTSTCTANVSLTTPPVLDGCGIASITRVPSTSTFPVGITSVVWTVTDVNGNSATTTQTVTVRDTTAPTFTTTPQNITVNAASTCTTVPLTAPAASDNCGVSSITRSPSGDTFCIGTTLVTWTATDASGNTATVSQTVTVRDVTPPTFTSTPQNLMVNGAPNCAAVTLTPPTATDNVGVVSITSSPVSGSSFCIGTTTVVWTATDASGNTTTINQTVTVRDVTPPTFTSTPQNLTVNGAPNCAAVPLTPPTATDNFGIVSITSSPVSGSSFCIGTTTVVWTATDASGNTATINQTVTVRDVTPPTFTSTPQSITVNGAPNCATVTLTPPTATDNFGVVSIESNRASGSSFCIGTTVVTWTATDASGNTATINQTVTVRDVTPPTFTSTPQNLTVNGAPNCAAVPLTPPTATDNFGVISIESNRASGSSFCIGTTLVTWTATDANGNTATINQTVTVRDVTPPTFTSTPQSITVNGAPNCATVTLTPPTATDNFGVVSIESNRASGSSFCIGTTVVTWTATDASGNTATINQTVTVNDVTPPTVTTPLPITVNGAPCIAVVTLTPPVANDNAGIASITRNPAGNTFSVGTTDVVWAVTDNSGNTTSVTQQIVVADVTAPTVVTKNITVQLGTNGTVTITDAAVDNGSTDTCGPITLSVSKRTFDCSNIGPNTVTLIVTDSSGNSAQSTAVVTVEGASITYYRDSDGDGFGNPQNSTTVCSNTPPTGFVTNNTDCDDTQSAINPNTVWYKDADDDGYSDGTTQTQCTQPAGFKLASALTATSGDCDDNNPAVNPGAPELCDGFDNNCNGQKDEGFPDANNNGIADCIDPANRVVSFTLINAGTDIDILTLTDGLQINQSQVQGLSLNIRANTNPAIVGSVLLTLSGPVNASRTENGAPYALFGDNNGNYSGRTLPAGNYILTARAFTGTNRNGIAGEIYSVRFSIVPPNVSVTGITTTPPTASLVVGSTLQVSATVLPSNATNKAVVWSTSNQGVASVSETGLVTALSTGEAIITATTQDGNFFDTTVLTVIQGNSLGIGSFTLVNAGTDTDILTLTDGLRISQSQVQGLSLNVRVNTNPSVVGSVLITLSGPVNRTITENVAPYALFGDRNGNYSGRNLPVGNYILTATPFSQSNRRGTMGISQTIRFSITSEALRVDGIQTESSGTDNPTEAAPVMDKEPQTRDIPRITRMYPNPVSDVINLELSERVDQKVEISIYDLKGVRLFIQELELEDGKLALDISNLSLKPGFFVLLVNTNGYPQTFKFLKK